MIRSKDESKNIWRAFFLSVFFSCIFLFLPFFHLTEVFYSSLCPFSISFPLSYTFFLSSLSCLLSILFFYPFVYPFLIIHSFVFLSIPPSLPPLLPSSSQLLFVHAFLRYISHFSFTFHPLSQKYKISTSHKWTYFYKFYRYMSLFQHNQHMCDFSSEFHHHSFENKYSIYPTPLRKKYLRPLENRGPFIILKGEGTGE